MNRFAAHPRASSAGPFLASERVSIQAAKRRARRRRNSAGGTMFVVAMTLAVLSTIGAWALQSAALEVKMAGYERQSTQTHYLAEYGVMAATQDLSPYTAPNFLGPAISGFQTANGAAHATCLSIPCLNFTVSPVVSTCPTEFTTVNPVAQTCFPWRTASAMPSGFGPTPSSMNPIDTADGGVSGAPGSLGATSTQGDFSVELTEVGPAPPCHGMSSNTTMACYWATVTSYGSTQAAGDTTSQGTEQLRARLEIGPISKISTTGN
jgi:Tfp pilus assembly protein PilX